MFEPEEQDRELERLLATELDREAREGIAELDRRMERALRPQAGQKRRSTTPFLPPKRLLRRALATSLVALLCLGLGIYLGHSYLDLGHLSRQPSLPLVLIENYSQPEVAVARSGAEDPRKMALDAASKVSDLTLEGDIPSALSYDSTVQVAPERSKIDEPRSSGERALDHSGNLFIAESAEGRILKLTPDGEEMVIAEGLSHPTSLAFGSAGNLYVAESGKGRILQIKPDKGEITPESEIAVFAIGFSSALEFERGREQGLRGPLYLLSSKAGDLLVADRTGSGTIVYKISPKSKVQITETEEEEGD